MCGQILLFPTKKKLCTRTFEKKAKSRITKAMFSPGGRVSNFEMIKCRKGFWEPTNEI